MQKIRWGIIGCGDVTEVKSGPGFQKADHSELIAVMRRDGKRAEDFARRHRVPKWYNDASALINDPDVNAIYIATPPGFHKEYTLMAAAAGKPVYCEKPMALSADEAAAMIHACKTAKVKLFIAHYRRALPRFLYIKEKIDAGIIGDLTSVSTALHKKPINEKNSRISDLPWRLNPSISGGGLFVDLATHTFDLLDFILGPIRSVAGYAGNQSQRSPAEDIVSATFVFESGVQGIGLWNFNSYTNFDLTEINGTLGKISFSVFDNKPIFITKPSGSDKTEIPNPPHVQQPMIQCVVNDLLKKEECSSKGETALRTRFIMDQILTQYYGKKPATDCDKSEAGNTDKQDNLFHSSGTYNKLKR